MPDSVNIFKDGIRKVTNSTALQIQQRLQQDLVDFAARVPESLRVPQTVAKPQTEIVELRLPRPNWDRPEEPVLPSAPVTTTDFYVNWNGEAVLYSFHAEEADE